jgi:hypothetical protein
LAPTPQHSGVIIDDKDDILFRQKIFLAGGARRLDRLQVAYSV